MKKINHKQIDAPNVQRSDYLMGNENAYTRYAKSLFEDGPYILLNNNTIKTYNNSIWPIIGKSAWYNLDSFNDIYSIVMCY
jgi:hypothetical protein